MRRPWLRPLLVWAFAAPALAVAVVLAFLAALFRGGPGGFWAVAPGYIRMVATCFGIRRRLEGWEALPEDIRTGRRPVIFIANHASHFDPPLLISTLPSHPVFIAKRELGRVPFLGWVIWLAGFIFIDRGNRAQAMASLAAAARRIHDGQSVVVFPEGTRSPDGTLLPFKPGGFKLAVEAGVPLVPLAIHGGAGILPRGDWRVRGGPYRMVVGAPLDSEGRDPGELMDQARHVMTELLLS
ncbi:MAG TPA: lysophospholipid acyltransferase family protein [Holophagaceae bacterium]|nr:lysophospholipid acyltransferase family protein [Holophagaceae bacterium]